MLGFALIRACNRLREEAVPHIDCFKILVILFQLNLILDLKT